MSGLLKNPPIREDGLSRQPAEPELQKETDGRIDRSEVRENPWDPLARKGRWRVWNSRRGKPSWPAVPTAPTGRTYGCKRSDQTIKKLLRHGGRPHMDHAAWVPAFAGTTR